MYFIKDHEYYVTCFSRDEWGLPIKTKGGRTMVQPSELFKQMQDFNRGACKSALENIDRLEEQTEKVLNLWINQTAGVPEQGKNAARMLVSMYKAGFGFYKKLLAYASGNGESFRENPPKNG